MEDGAAANPGAINHLQRVIDPLRLRLLVEVAARGSISAAAAACRIGQPSASQHLRHLEAAVGHRLVERHPSGSRLTPAGRIVVRHGANVLTSLDAMAEELLAYTSGHRGRLAVGVSTTGSYLIPHALGAFVESHPGVDVDVRVGSSAAVHDMVRSRDVALGVSGDLDGGEGIQRQHLFDDEVVGIAATGGLMLEGGALAPERLAGRTLIMLPPGSSQVAAAGAVLERLADQPATKTVRVDSEETVKRAVRDGDAVSFLSRLAVSEELRRGELMAFRVLGFPRLVHPLRLSWNAGASLTTPQRAFAAALTTAWRAAADRELPDTAISAAG